MADPRRRGTGVVLLSSIAVAIAAALLTSWIVQRGKPSAQSIPPSAFNRVLQRGTIRCGYVSNPPSCIIDPNTKKVTGIVADAMETIAKSANLKLEWTEEAGFGSMVEGLRANRYDVVPCGIWPTAARAREAEFTDPLFYSPVGAYVRPSDTKFKAGDYGAINSPSVRIATIDGELGETIARNDFPKAQRIGSPQMTELTTSLLNVKDNKADVVFVERYFAEQFLAKNPGSVKNLVPNQPIRIFPNTIILRRGDLELKAF
jgi:cystine transport system substrate-binding protein